MTAEPAEDYTQIGLPSRADMPGAYCMQIKLVRHAKNRLRLPQRRHAVNEDDVLRAVSSPAVVTESVGARRNHWLRLGERWLRVTVKLEDAVMLVVTVTLRRKGPV